MGKRIYRRVSGEQYDLVKKMFAFGMSNSEVRKAIGLCQTTVARINRTKDYEDYLNLIRSPKFRNPTEESVKPEQVEINVSEDKYQEIYKQGFEAGVKKATDIMLESLASVSEKALE